MYKSLDNVRTQLRVKKIRGTYMTVFTVINYGIN